MFNDFPIGLPVSKNFATMSVPIIHTYCRFCSSCSVKNRPSVVITSRISGSTAAVPMIEAFSNVTSLYFTSSTRFRYGLYSI